MDGIEQIASKGLHEKVLELALNLPGKDFLDVPAGYGALTDKLLAAGKRVVAGDIDIEKFRAERNHPNLRLLHLDLNDAVLQLPDDFFDIAVSIEGIEHFESPWNFIRNMCRVLKKGGVLILTTPNILNIRSRFRYFVEGRYEHFKRPLEMNSSSSADLENYHISPMSFFELQFMLARIGFYIRAIHANRLSERNLFTRLLKPLFDLSYLYKNRRDRRRHRGDHSQLYEHIMSKEIFFGECLIVVAVKR